MSGFWRTRPRPRSTARSTSSIAARSATAAGRAATARTRTGAAPALPSSGLIVRMVGVRRAATRPSRDVVTFRLAFTAGAPSRSPARLPGDFLGGEHGTFPADPLRGAADAHDHAAQAGPDGTAHVLFH